MPQLAAIFDMDGVLVDSYHAHFESWRRMYGELGREYTEQAFAADFGRTNRDILYHALGDEFPESKLVVLADRKESLYRDIIRDDLPVMDGVGELLDALATAGFRLAVGSSGPPENVALVLEGLPGGRHIEVTVTGADVKRGKPDPQVFQIAADRLSVLPEYCVVIEDAIHGVEAAHRAGMKAIALVGTLDQEELAGADLVVESLRELTPGKVEEVILWPKR